MIFDVKLYGTEKLMFPYIVIYSAQKLLGQRRVVGPAQTPKSVAGGFDNWMSGIRLDEGDHSFWRTLALEIAEVVGEWGGIFHCAGF